MCSLHPTFKLFARKNNVKTSFWRTVMGCFDRFIYLFLLFPTPIVKSKAKNLKCAWNCRQNCLHLLKLQFIFVRQLPGSVKTSCHIKEGWSHWNDVSLQLWKPTCGSDSTLSETHRTLCRLCQQSDVCSDFHCGSKGNEFQPFMWISLHVSVGLLWSTLPSIDLSSFYVQAQP